MLCSSPLQAVQISRGKHGRLDLLVLRDVDVLLRALRDTGRAGSHSFERSAPYWLSANLYSYCHVAPPDEAPIATCQDQARKDCGRAGRRAQRSIANPKLLSRSKGRSRPAYQAQSKEAGRHKGDKSQSRRPARRQKGKPVQGHLHHQLAG